MGAKLIAEEGLLEGLTLSLEGRDEWTIGRDPDLSDLTVEDSKVSRKHLLCRRTSAGFLVENLSTTNPVQVNGVILREPYLLQVNDLVKIGSTIFRFSQDAEEIPPVAPEALPAAPPGEDDKPYETIFQDLPESIKESPFDLKERGRWLLKVVGGPQIGAEFSLEKGKAYLIGTDVATCDIVFQDLSISRQHARLMIREDEQCDIEDLESRNGVLIDGQKIEGSATLPFQHLITLGTTSFVIIDREKASETIISPTTFVEAPGEKEEIIEEEIPVEKKEEVVVASVAPEKEAVSPVLSAGELILCLILLTSGSLAGLATWTLFKPSTTIVPHVKNYTEQLETALKEFPSITYTYNPSTGSLFLLGHVLTEVDKSQLLYNLQGLTFITSVKDNIIVDEYVWKNANQLLSKNPLWTGITLHSPTPGKFVVNGYLKTRAQAAALNDYLNLHFNYLDLLVNQVVIEEDLMSSIQTQLLSQNFEDIKVQIENGELILIGYIPQNLVPTFNQLVTKWQNTPGIRAVKAFVVPVSPQEAIADLSQKYQITGYSRRGDTVISVVVNGKILSLGDTIDGMVITSIQPNIVFLEKDGLKYRINYNQ